MRTIHVKEGKDLALIGAAEKRVEAANFPEHVAIQPADFYGLKPKLLINEGDIVQVGTPIFHEKKDPRIRIVSPVQGKIVEIRRGDKRAISAIVIKIEQSHESVSYTRFAASQIPSLTRQQVIDHLLEAGSWPLMRQRPFDHIADPNVVPKAIFVKAIDTNPLAPDYDCILEEKKQDFQTGLDLLGKLTDGRIFLCVSKGAQSPALIDAKGVEVCVFDGPHPAGNVSTHIAALSPIGSRDHIVWYVEAQDVAAMGKTFLTGCFSSERIIALTGERVGRPVHKKTLRGASLKSLTGQQARHDTRFISGSVLTGKDAGPEGFLGFYDAQVSLIPKGGRRELLGWALPGLKKYSFSRTFLSGIKTSGAVSLDSDLHGSGRAIVLNHIYDRYVALDVMTFFLIKAILAGEIEEMERLGILECAPEDFALASFVCPSKTDVCGIIQQGLDLIKEEG